MAAIIARRVVTFRLTGATASLLQKRLLSKPPPLPGLDQLRIAVSRYTAPALSHSLRITSPIRINQVRSQVGWSVSSHSPLYSGSNFNDRPYTGTKLITTGSGCDFEHWLVVIDKPGGEGATKQQMIDCYIQTLAKVLGSEEEAKKKIYSVSCDRYLYLGFGCAIDEKTSNKFEGLPGVLFVLPDSYLDGENKDYGAELFVNGEIVQRSPERQRRVEPVPKRAQCKPKYYDRTLCEAT